MMGSTTHPALRHISFWKRWWLSASTNASTTTPTKTSKRTQRTRAKAHGKTLPVAQLFLAQLPSSHRSLCLWTGPRLLATSRDTPMCTCTNTQQSTTISSQVRASAGRLHSQDILLHQCAYVSKDIKLQHTIALARVIWNDSRLRILSVLVRLSVTA